MSRRQPASTPAKSTAAAASCATFPARAHRPEFRRAANSTLGLNFEHSIGVQAFQKRFRLGEVELLVLRFDEQKEAVRTRTCEIGEIKYRMIRAREAIQPEHAEGGRQRGAENGQLERNRNPSRPAIVRTAADVPRPADHVGVIAHEKSE